MMQFFEFLNVGLYERVSSASDFLWNYLLIYVLVGTGIFYTLRLKFIQIRKFPTAFKQVFGNVSLKGKAANQEGMSSFQALATAIAAQVGTGNLAGAATALTFGGPGAVFWIWISAFFGMATIFAEATLAQKTRVILPDGRLVGGPVYYIKHRFTNVFGRILAASFAVLIILALGFMGIMVQSNSIAHAIKGAVPINPLIVGLLLALFAGIIFIGGVKRIVSFTEKVVPLMCLLYLIFCITLLALHANHIPGAFYHIFVGAFHPEAVVGGGLGIGIKQAMRYGVARGLFSNEAGMGSTPHAHALAKVKHPYQQGYSAMIGVFVDTFIVLTMTTLAILVTDVLPKGYDGTLSGVALTQAAFETSFGFWGNAMIAITMLFFALSTIIGWYFFAEANVRYLFGNKAIPIYSVIVLVFIFMGSGFKVDLVWLLADFFNGLMVLPNLLALLFSAGIVVMAAKEADQG